MQLRPMSSPRQKPSMQRVPLIHWALLLQPRVQRFLPYLTMSLHDNPPVQSPSFPHKSSSLPPPLPLLVEPVVLPPPVPVPAVPLLVVGLPPAPAVPLVVLPELVDSSFWQTPSSLQK